MTNLVGQRTFWAENNVEAAIRWLQSTAKVATPEQMRQITRAAKALNDAQAALDVLKVMANDEG